MNCCKTEYMCFTRETWTFYLQSIIQKSLRTRHPRLLSSTTFQALRPPSYYITLRNQNSVSAWEEISEDFSFNGCRISVWWNEKSSGDEWWRLLLNTNGQHPTQMLPETWWWCSGHTCTDWPGPLAVSSPQVSSEEPSPVREVSSLGHHQVPCNT